MFRSHDRLFSYAAVGLFSFSIIALEVVYFHLLLVVTNYLSATFIISLAMLGIASGGVAGFYLKARTEHITLGASVLCMGSMVLAYYNIITIDELRYPFFLILPFFFGSVVLSCVFAKINSNNVYFVNLLASATGVLFPIFTVSSLNSENTLIVLLFVPALVLLMAAIAYRSIVMRVSLAVVSVALIL